MKDRLFITVSDIKGTHYYNINQSVKQTAIYLICIIILLYLFAFLTINYFNDEWQAAKQTNQQLKQINELLRSNNDKLLLELDDQYLFIEAVTTRVKDIEALAGNKISISHPNLLQRIEIAGMTIAQKKLMLSVIPSGKALKKYRRISSTFGVRIHPVTGKKHLHTGIDYGVRAGTPIYATADGVVKYVRSRYDKGYGNLIKIQHSLGFETLYAHLSKTFVKIGQYVKKGTKIGLSGNTGISTGPHLHYEIRFVGRALDPKPFTAWSLKHFDDLFNQEKSIPWQSFQNHINKKVQLTSIPPSLMDAG